MKKRGHPAKSPQEGNGEYEERVQGRVMTRSALAVVALCAFFWLARVFQADRLSLPEVARGITPPLPPATLPLVHLWMYARLKNRVKPGKRPVLPGVFSRVYMAVFACSCEEVHG